MQADGNPFGKLPGHPKRLALADLYLRLRRCRECGHSVVRSRIAQGRLPDLAFIDAYTRVKLRPPAEADIQRRSGVTPPSAHYGSYSGARWPDPAPGVSRSIEVLVPPEQLPVLKSETSI